MQVKRLWTGTVALVASGPSLSPAQVNYLRGRCRVIVINDNYRLAPWADALYAADRSWWEHHQPKFGGLRFTQYQLLHVQEAAAELRTAERFGVHAVGGRPRPGLSRDPAVIHHGHNSGYQAMNLAFHLGAERMLLVGYDLQRTGDKSHWFGDHPPGFNNLGNLPQWIRAHDVLARDLEGEGVEVINCTTETALTQYRRARLEDVI